MLITCYNKLEFIADAIRSAKAEYEHVIVVDDCSTDGSREVIDAFDNLEKIYNNTNIGVTKATIEGLNYAVTRGYSFVVMLDGDDLLAPGTFNVFNYLIEQEKFTAIYSQAVRSKFHDMRQHVKYCKLEDFYEVKQPLKQWLSRGKATTAFCAKPGDILANISPYVGIQDHQIGYSIHKNSEKIAYISAKTHYCSVAAESNLSSNKYAVVSSQIKLYSIIYNEVKNYNEVKRYARRTHNRCGAMRHFPNRVGYLFMIELFIRRFILPIYTPESILRLSQRILQKIE